MVALVLCGVLSCSRFWYTSHGIARPPAAMPAFRDDYTIDQVCKRYGTKIDEFRDPHFGPMEIYKLDWSLQAGN